MYKMSVLPKIPQGHILQLNTMIEKYLWQKGHPKIPTAILQNERAQCGAKLVNFEVKDTSLKAAWAKLILTHQYDGSVIYDMCQGLRERVWTANLNKRDVKEDGFWGDVLRAWCEYHYDSEPEGKPQMLWKNSHIRIGDKPIYWSDADQKGLQYVSDLIKNKNVISAPEAQSEYGLDIMRYNSLISAIPKGFLLHAREPA